VRGILLRFRSAAEGVTQILRVHLSELGRGREMTAAL
jgi:hypothetical protein